MTSCVLVWLRSRLQGVVDCKSEQSCKAERRAKLRLLLYAGPMPLGLRVALCHTAGGRDDEDPQRKPQAASGEETRHNHTHAQSSSLSMTT
eukprot:5330034-Amphidinium_carterae.1